MPIKIDCPECGGSKWMEGSTPSCMGGAKVPCEYCKDGKITVYTEAEMQKAVEAYTEYIDLLGDEIHDLMGIAYVHGWRSSRHSQGEKARAKIQALKE